MRARNIKPGFFKNEELGELKFEERILFLGLWCLCDREGFFEKRNKKIAIEIFPYDRSIDEEKIEKMLCNLMSRHLITCNDMYGHVIKFTEHQRPHPHEAKSDVPDDIKKVLLNQCHDMSCNVMKCPSDILNTDILNTDMTHPDEPEEKPLSLGEFENVKIKESEYKKIVEKYNQVIADKIIESMSIYLKQNNKRYKDYYAALLNWLKRDYPDWIDGGTPSDDSGNKSPADMICKICKKEKTYSRACGICWECEDESKNKARL